MAAGQHWEWRAFGSITLRQLMAFHGLRKEFGPDDDGWEGTDEYIWCAGCAGNVKLRDDRLKIKRRLERTPDGCELWREDPADEFTFPLDDRAVDLLAAELAIDLPPAVESARRSAEALREAVAHEAPAIHLVRVEKHRLQFRDEHDGQPLLVELAELRVPVQGWSIGVEGPPLPPGDEAASQASRRAVGAFAQRLHAAGSMRVAGYLEMLAAWCG